MLLARLHCAHQLRLIPFLLPAKVLQSRALVVNLSAALGFLLVQLGLLGRVLLLPDKIASEWWAVRGALNERVKRVTAREEVRPDAPLRLAVAAALAFP